MSADPSVRQALSHNAEVEALPPDENDEQTVVPLKIEDWLTVIVMAALALITFANVLVRYFTDQSFAWTEEFSVFLMIVLSLVAGSASVARNRQIRIEYFADSGPEARQRALARFGAFMVFGLAWMGVFLAAGMVVALVTGLLSLAVGTAAGGLMVGAAMVLAAMFFSSVVFTFRDCFEPPEEYLQAAPAPATEDAPPPPAD